MIHECLTGEQPYGTYETLIDKMNAILNEEPPKLDPQKFNKDIC